MIRRSDPITFTGAVMGIGAVCLIVGSGLQGGYAPVADFGWARWPTIGYPGLFGGAIGFLLWAYALAHTTPTRVSAAVTVNPIVAGIVGAVLLNEPLRWNLVIGLLAVLIGIWIATSNAAPARRSSWPPSGVQGGAPVPRATRESKPRLSVAAECSCAPQQVTRSADAAPSRCNA